MTNSIMFKIKVQGNKGKPRIPSSAASTLKFYFQNHLYDSWTCNRENGGSATVTAPPAGLV